jgi:hypothetical protein
MPRKRPFGVTLLLLMVLSLLAWGIIRLYAAFRWWTVLIEFRSTVSPLYLSITGAGWGMVGCVLLWSMFAGKPWSPRAIFTSILVWLIEYWIERVFFESARANLPFAVVGSILIISITLISTLHKSTKNFFTRSEEYEQHNKNPGP